MAEVLNGPATIKSFKATNAATVYQLTVIEEAELGYYLMFSTGFNGFNYGQWVHIHDDEIAWSYLTEKCKALDKYEGDKPGWVKVCAEAGIRVFN